MANEIQYFGDPANESGLTLTARVYDDTGTQVGSDVSLTEVGSLAIYRGNMPSASAGGYIIRVFNSTIMLSQGPIYWDGSAEIDVQTLDADLAADVLQQSIESGFTLQECIRLMNSVLLSKVSGAGTGTEVFRDINDTKDRVTSSVDSSGNRTSVALDGS